MLEADPHQGAEDGRQRQRAPTQRLGIRTGLRRLQHQGPKVLQETNQPHRYRKQEGTGEPRPTGKWRLCLIVCPPPSQLFQRTVIECH
ncbi:hypothetical protein LEMLEM_LOCUS20149 [Lemmus lemmus]